jgi:hypothetical protein
MVSSGTPTLKRMNVRSREGGYCFALSSGSGRRAPGVMHPNEDRDLRLALMVTASTERCVVCNAPSCAIGALGDEDSQKTRIVGPCAVCSYLVKLGRQGPPLLFVCSH